MISDPLYLRLLLGYLLACLLALALFGLFPALDLAAARYFARSVPHPALVPLNNVLRGAMETVAWASLFAGMLLWLRRRIARPVLRCWAFVALNLLLAPGLIVNVLLKEHLGRARPDHLIEFGGTATFTPAWQFSDECRRNCSFASGDVALAATLSICALVLIWPFVSRRGRGMAVAISVLLTLGTALLRLSLGRHFASDAVFSVLISAGTALVLYRCLNMGQVDLRSLRILLRGPLAARPGRSHGRPDA